MMDDPEDPQRADEDNGPDRRAEGTVGRARRVMRRAAPVLRDVNAVIERHGGLEEVRDVVVARAGYLARRVSDAVANATAIEGTVVEREPETSPAPSAIAKVTSPIAPERTSIRWRRVGLVVGMAVFGALILQRRRS